MEYRTKESGREFCALIYFSKFHVRSRILLLSISYVVIWSVLFLLHSFCPSFKMHYLDENPLKQSAINNYFCRWRWEVLSTACYKKCASFYQVSAAIKGLTSISSYIKLLSHWSSRNNVAKVILFFVIF